jgi:hypothetical protein
MRPGAVELWSYTFPLSASDAARVDSGLRTIPALLAQARVNLTGNGRTCGRSAPATSAIRALRSPISRRSSARRGAHVARNVRRAKAATDSFSTWLAAKIPSKTGSSGIGVANYDWYLKNVQLVPYTWQDEVRLMERELARARSSLALAEQRNRDLPALTPLRAQRTHAAILAARRRVHGVS